MKKMLMKLVLLGGAILANTTLAAGYQLPIDKKATPETKALYQQLQALQGKQFLFGHQDTTAYGYTWEKEPARSDVKDVTGAFPALYGWDVSNIELQKSENIDGVNFEIIKRGVKEAYLRGGVNTFSWHMTNPASGGNHSDNKTPAVQDIIPGGSKHALFKGYLDAFVAFNEQLVVKNSEGKDIHVPIIFRPFHEHNGEWFWWGKGHASEENYIKLWRFTINYLLNVKKQHNLIIAFSPDRSRVEMDDFEKNYLYAYPGDKYVDILGLDDYWDLGRDINTTPAAEQQKIFIASLEGVAQLAKKKRKVPALTEAGLESVTNPKFFTEVLLKGMTASELTKQITYVMLWRNATNGGYNKKHFYVPYKDHASAADFITFKQQERVLFGDEIPNLYVKP